MLPSTIQCRFVEYPSIPYPQFYAVAKFMANRFQPIGQSSLNLGNNPNAGSPTDIIKAFQCIIESLFRRGVDYDNDWLESAVQDLSDFGHCRIWIRQLSLINGMHFVRPTSFFQYH